MKNLQRLSFCLYSSKRGRLVWKTPAFQAVKGIAKLMNYIRFWQADGESEKISIRTRTSLGQMAEEGHYKGGSPAFGCELVKSGRINKRKHELYDLKINEAEAAEKVSILKAEVVKSIQGKSAFSPQMLSELIEEAETEATECEGIRDTAERAVRDSELLPKNICARYDEIISWAELYDNASMEAKKMIVNSLIQRVNVFKGYRLEIEFNFDLRQFFAGLDKELQRTFPHNKKQESR